MDVSRVPVNRWTCRCIGSDELPDMSANLLGRWCPQSSPRSTEVAHEDFSSRNLREPEANPHARPKADESSLSQSGEGDVMDWFLHNVIADLYGPHFLAFYAIVIGVV